MPWFKVDDHFHSNKKVLRIPRNRRCASVGLWVLVGTWATSNLTDGHVPDYIPEELGGTPRMVDDLVKSGLWTVENDGEHAYPNWKEYQPTREKVEDEREASRERMRAARAAAAAKRASHAQKEAGSAHVRPNISEVRTNISEVRDSFANPDPTRPDPTRPDLIKEETALAPLAPLAPAAPKPATKGSRLTADWIPSKDAIDQMSQECPHLNLQSVHRSFIDYWLSVPGSKGVKLDWDATWRNWMRREAESGNGGRGGNRRQAETDSTFDDLLARAAERDQQDQRKALGA